MSTAKVNEILNNAGTALPDNLLPVTSSAWVNFNGTGVVAIRDNYNVASITDNGSGDYVVNMSNPLNNANYSCSVSSSVAETNVLVTGVGSFIVRTRTSPGGSVDANEVFAVVFGGQ